MFGFISFTEADDIFSDFFMIDNLVQYNDDTASVDDFINDGYELFDVSTTEWGASYFLLKDPWFGEKDLITCYYSINLNKTACHRP